jgi:uridylate kinase
MVVNLSNIYYLYDKDPHKHEDAKPLERLTWKKVRELVGTEWIPGSNVPFDPVASALAQEIGLQVIITKGNDFENLEHILNGLPFKGSIIDPDLL